MGKSGRRAYGFDDIAIVPEPAHPRPRGRRHLLGDRRLPLRAAAHGARPWTASSARPPPSRSAASAASACSTSRASGPATRTPSRCFEEIAELDDDKATRRMQEIYPEPIKPELIGRAHPRDQRRRRRRRAPRSPRSAPSRFATPSSTAELDLLVIQGTVVSAEHVSKTVEPLNLKTFVRELDIPVIVGGCASYQAALHLMRTGAAGVLVGVGPGHACTTRGVLGIGVPQATAIADARAARMRHLDETGVYVHVIADGGMAHRRRHRQGHRLRRRRRDDRLAAGRRRRGARPGLPLGHGHLPPDAAPRRPGAGPTIRGTLEEILVGPAHENDGRMNLFGAPAHVDGHLRLRDAQGVPEGRGHGRPRPADRGQGACRGRRASGMGH